MSVSHLTLRRRLRERGLDGVTLLVIPGVVFVLALFIYPFLYGLVLSFQPKEGGWLANYAQVLLRAVPLRHHPHHADGSPCRSRC